MNPEDIIKKCEVWKDIPGWEGLYQASTYGRIKRLPVETIYSNGDRHLYAEKIYKFSPAGNGYYIVTLRRPYGKPVKCYVHRLVALTFLDRVDGYDVVNHLDCDRTNNRVENLEWTDLSGNAKHSIRAYGAQGAIKLKPVVCIETDSVFESASDAADWLEDLTSNKRAAAGNIWAAASGLRPSALGLHWRFAAESEGVEDE